MKKLLMTVLLAGGVVCGGFAQELSQTLYFDFGTVTPSQGTITEGADANGHYWNNITNNTSGNKYASKGTVYEGLVNSDNAETGFKIILNSRFSTNGKSGGGGLLNPDADLLGDMAVASATEDYFFIESSEDNSNFTISGLDPQKGYRFHVFASRKAGDTRTGVYRMEGINKFSGELQLAGTNLGGDGINQNIANILVSELVYPDDEGNILFTVSRKTGAYIALNALKIEEMVGGRRPEGAPVVVSASLVGTAAENGESVAMHMISPDGKNNGVFECFTMLRPGSFRFEGMSAKDAPLEWGVDSDGKLSPDSEESYVVESEQLSMVRVDFSSQTMQIVPITSWTLVGSVVPGGWGFSNNPEIEYQGDGVWRSTVEMSKVSTVSDPERFIFVMNKTWDWQMKRVKGSERSVGFASDGFALDDIRINHGTYTVTLDFNDFVYYIESPDGINENRVSVMGSSVANGQGAADNHGYAYMYGQLLESRHADGLSEYPLHTSGISVNGNSTVNLLDRYNDLIHDFGRYVIFGVSLGNEGIHGAADQQAVYDQFSRNMQLLISKAREDGKIPVVMNNYTRGDFGDSDYEYVRRMNLQINSWDVPSVNLLGAIDNGRGNWADGFQNGDDIYHPNTDGHAEFFHAIPPSLFDALKAGKPQPVRMTGNSVIIEKEGKVEFTPEDVVHPFALVVSFNDIPEGDFASIATANGDASLSMSGKILTYTSVGGETISGTVDEPAAVAGEEAHKTPVTVTLSHYHAQGRTLLFAGDRLLGELSEKVAPEKVTVAPASDKKLDLGEVMFYRSALNADEVKALNEGTMIKSSLEMYLPFDGASDLDKNHAQSMTEATVSTGITSGIEVVSPEEAAVPFKVIGLEGRAKVIASAPVEVRVCSIEGRVIYDHTVEITADFPLPAGIYLVNNVKVAVR